MSDTKISAATAVVTPAATDEYATNQGGASKRTARSQVHKLETDELLLIDDGVVGAPGLAVNGDPNTGDYAPGADIFARTVGGVEAFRHTEVSGSILVAVEANVGLTAHTDSAQGSGVITSTHNVYDIVANAGDCATLPAAFQVGTLVYVKNGAASTGSPDVFNSMDVFPALNHTIAGSAVNVAVGVAAGDFAVFMGVVAPASPDAAIWEKIMGGTA